LRGLGRPILRFHSSVIRLGSRRAHETEQNFGGLLAACTRVNKVPQRGQVVVVFMLTSYPTPNEWGVV
jgi:hypothetical protein